MKTAQSHKAKMTGLEEIKNDSLTDIFSGRHFLHFAVLSYNRGSRSYVSSKVATMEIL